LESQNFIILGFNHHNFHKNHYKLVNSILIIDIHYFILFIEFQILVINFQILIFYLIGLHSIFSFCILLNSYLFSNFLVINFIIYYLKYHFLIFLILFKFKFIKIIQINSNLMAKIKYFFFLHFLLL
jgi:hypothetical protein